MSSKNALIISHVYTTVPVEDLKEYLLSKNLDTLVYIQHPLLYKPTLPGSSCTIYRKGKIVQTYEKKHYKLPMLLTYVLDSLFTIYWTYKSRIHFDFVVCLDNLNTLSGILLKLLGRVKKVIFYTIDYVPNRFTNKTLNNFYHAIDKTAVRYSDKTWVLTQRMIDGRKNLRSIDNKDGKQIIVPIGIWFSRIKRKTFAQIQKNVLVYAGGLLPHQGIQLMIKAMPYIKKEIPNIQFKIIGIGDYRIELEKLVEKYSLTDCISFLGYFPSHKDVEEILTTCTLGIGLYSKELDIWSYYADPSKMKSYLSAGLPIISTDVTYFAQVIRDTNCGVVVNYREKDVAKNIIKILTNTNEYKKMRANAIKLAASLDWTAVYDNAFRESHI